MKAAAFHTLACLRRDPGPVLGAGVVGAAGALGAFLGGTTLVEGRTSALVLAGSGARLTLVFVLAALVTTHLDRLRQGRELERLVTWPLSPLALVAGLWLGWLPAAALLLLGALAVPLVLGADPGGLLSWAATLAGEALVVVALALFAGVTLRRGVALVATLSLYAFARLSGLFLAVAHQRATTPLGEGILAVLSPLLPRLDLSARSTWLAAGGGPDPATALGLAIQGTGAILLVLALAARDLRRSARP
jgi:ABC-2 type transport system permease protein